MKGSISSRIMLPMALFMVLLPICTYWAFNAVASNYMRELARKSLADSLDSTRSLVGEVYSSYSLDIADENLTEEEKQELAKEILHKARTVLRHNQFDSNLIVLNNRGNIIFPSEIDDEVWSISSCFDLGEDALPSDKSTSPELIDLNIDGRNYIACMVCLSAPVESEPTHTNYLIVYNSINDVRDLMRTSAVFVLIITGVLSMIALGGAYLAARRISISISQLGEHLSGVGLGHFTPTEQRSSIQDVQSLITAANNMISRLDKYDRGQKSFFQNASHELRTPLMSIQGYAEGIQCGVWNDPAEAAGIIADESRRLTELVDELLTLSRLDNDQQSVDIEEIDLAAFLANTMERMRGMRVGDDIRLEKTAGPDCCIIRADEVLLTKCVQNLLSNAIRYAASLVTTRIVADSQSVRLYIYNDGPSIPREKLEQIFDRFYKGEGGHCGIGLSLARSSAEYMGGSIRALPLDQGAEFEVSFVPAEDNSPSQIQ